MEFEEINPNVWKHEKVGDSVEGVLLEKRKEVGANNSNAYYLEKDGNKVMVWGTTIIDQRMAYVKVGEYIRITFTEATVNAKKQPLNIFKVEKAKTEDGLLGGVKNVLDDIGNIGGDISKPI